jgi:hypothetical protein
VRRRNLDPGHALKFGLGASFCYAGAAFSAVAAEA